MADADPAKKQYFKAFIARGTGGHVAYYKLWPDPWVTNKDDQGSPKHSFGGRPDAHQITERKTACPVVVIRELKPSSDGGKASGEAQLYQYAVAVAQAAKAAGKKERLAERIKQAWQEAREIHETDFTDRYQEIPALFDGLLREAEVLPPERGGGDVPAWIGLTADPTANSFGHKLYDTGGGAITATQREVFPHCRACPSSLVARPGGIKKCCQGTTAELDKLPLLHSCPGGVHKPTLHSP